MPDPRVSKLAQVLVQYSLDLQPGELFTLSTSPLAEELSLEVYKEAVKAGAHITVQNSLPGTEEIFYKFASQAQLEAGERPILPRNGYRPRIWYNYRYPASARESFSSWAVISIQA